MKPGTIIWAMDPTQKAADSSQLVKEMRMWAKKLNVDVQPVSVFSEANVYMPADITYSWQLEIKRSFQKSMDQYLKATKTTDFLKPQMLLALGISNRAYASELARFAEASKAGMIFAHTRAKKSMNPFRLGGFAETLIATSRVPVLLMNQKAKATSNVNSILFPTDFSAEASAALRMLEPWCEAFGAEVHLFNHVENPGDSLNYLKNRTAYKDLVADLEAERTQRMKNAEKQLSTRGVKSKSTVKLQKKYLGQEILEIAKKESVSAIAVVSRSGRFAQALIGGVPRDVVLGADRPVIVFFRPKSVPQKKAKTPKKIRRSEKTPDLMNENILI
jgi:nucleotide-binding universal stress UspA family protein